MADIYMLSYRANINVFQYPETLRRDNDERRIILYDDHRTIINVIYAAMHEGLFGEETPNVISFDRHDDAVRLTPQKKQQLKAVRKSCFPQRNDKRIWQFTEFGLSVLDDDWVRAGMELGLIKHYIGFGNKEEDAGNIESGYEKYMALDRYEHHLYSNGHLDWEFGARGVISDNNYRYAQKHTDITNDLQFHNGQFDNSPVLPFVFDIDLDCFSDIIEDRRMAWPESIFIEHYLNNPRLSSFIRTLLARSSMITICREPEFCGGIGESNRILELLDSYWFDGALKTQRII